MAGADITQFTRLDKLMQAAAGRTARQAAKPLEGDTGHIFMLGKITREQLVDTIRLQLAGMGFVLGSFQRHRLQAIFQLYLGTESHGLETDGLRTYLVRGLYGRALQRDLQIPQPIDMYTFSFTQIFRCHHALRDKHGVYVCLRDGIPYMATSGLIIRSDPAE